MQRRFVVLDVFTDKPLSGNQLAVVLDGEGLDGAQMQSIAREFNLSETVFVRPATDLTNTANIRIFTPGIELPFAGHPTVGTAIALAIEQGMNDAGQGVIVLEEAVGPVRCDVVFDSDGAAAQFDLPKLPYEVPFVPQTVEMAAAFGIDPQEIGFENHAPSAFSGGVPYIFVPVRDLATMEKVGLAANEWVAISQMFEGKIPAAFLYCREAVGIGSDFHARMFAPHEGIPEDPATGSAVAAFAGVIAQFDNLRDGSHKFHIEQGIQMGRPSRITLDIDLEGGRIAAGRIGGNAVVFSRGHLDI